MQTKTMRLLINLFFLVSLSSFSSTCDLTEIDSEVNREITSKFDRHDPNLWTDLETEFYHRLTDLGLKNSETDSLKAFRELMIFVTESGYPKEFFIDKENPDIKKLISDLKLIGFDQGDESAHEFLYSLIDPMLEDCTNRNELLNPPRDMLVAFGSTNPDSIGISYDLATLQFYKYYDVKDLERPGLYKSLLIFYFSRMMNEKK
jgi:hypothetical protein